MRKKWNKNGFTMAELLIVVAIIVVLAAVAFIALQTHQKNLEMAERDSIAKEIYFAAQNHLIMAESQGYPGLTGEADFGTALADTSGTRGDVKGVYYTTTHDRKGIMGLMLPFGSIDEIVRCGSYIIHYQKEPARVLDVFYWEEEEEQDEQDYDWLMDNRGNRNARRDRSPMTGWYGGPEAVETGIVLNAPTVVVDNGARLTVTVTDTNKDLTKPGGTTPTQVNTVLELIITGEPAADGSVAKCVILLKNPGTPLSDNDRIKVNDDGTYTIVLDDITTPKTANGDGLHFADLNDYADSYADSSDSRIWFMADPDKGEKIKFKPGENITVEAVAFSNDTLASIAYSGGQTTNSLFADVDTGEETIGTDGAIQKGEEPPTALVANFRHLENLDATVSGLDKNLDIHNARQTEDLVWADATGNTGFVDKIKADKTESGATAQPVQVYKRGSTDGSGNDSYLPVTLDYELTYEAAYTEGEGEAAVAKCHSITGLTIGTAETPYSGDAGVFGKSTVELNVNNLALVDFDIRATGNAGALAGSLTGSLPDGGSITNVVAYNSDAFDTAKNGAATVASIGTGTSSGSAGGLVGTMTNVSMERCAAALVVSSEGKHAGGLVGEAHGTSTIEDSYSGGHVEAVDGAIGYSSTKPNVSAPSGYAGGLIGSAGAGIENCYSTCSVSGSTAGGLVGKAGTDVKNSYCTGLVQGASATSEVGAFAGELTGNLTDCHYYEIMNPVTDDSGVITYLPPVPGKTAEEFGTSLSPLDATATAYDTFVGAPANWAAAQPYCDELADYYARTTGEGDDAQTSAVYPLRPLSCVSATATGDTPADFVATHYGDWPMPETLVVNTK